MLLINRLKSLKKDSSFARRLPFAPRWNSKLSFAGKGWRRSSRERGWTWPAAGCMSESARWSPRGWAHGALRVCVWGCVARRKEYPDVDELVVVMVRYVPAPL